MNTDYTDAGVKHRMSFPMTWSGLGTLLLGSSVFVIAMVTVTFLFVHFTRLTGSMLALALFVLVLLFSAVLAVGIHNLTTKLSAVHEQRFESTQFQNSKKISRQLKQLAYYDANTHLPNQAHLLKILQKFCTVENQKHSEFVLLLIDITGYKSVSERFGAFDAESFIAALANRLYEVTKPRSYVLSKSGATEFAVVMQARLNDHHLYQFSQALLMHANKPIDVQHNPCSATPCMGVARFPKHGSNSKDIYANAVLALNHARSSGSVAASIYNKDLRISAVRTRHVEKRLLKNLENPFTTELRNHYQPKVNLLTGEMMGVEALLRWHDSELGYINPTEAFSMAVQVSLEHKLSEFLLLQVIEDIKTWSNSTAQLCPVSFNLHPNLLNNEADIINLLDTYEKSELSKDSLVLEVTEDCVLREGADSTKSILDKLRENGYQLSLDDFGTGFAPLTHLKNVPAQELKIDRSFVLDLIENPESEAIVKALVSFARETNKRVVAEGIETVEQLWMLREIGCSIGQGYLFSPAVPAEELTSFTNEEAPFAAVVKGPLYSISHADTVEGQSVRQAKPTLDRR